MEEKAHISIKEFAEDDRPREKLVALGRQALSDAELLAIILGSGSHRETAVELARKVLNGAHNNINELAKLSVNDLKKFKGIGLAKAVTIAAAFELGRRRLDSGEVERTKITGSAVAYQVLQQKLSDLQHEEFYVLLLNRANLVIKTIPLSKGGISGTVVDVRLIVKPAIENHASGVVIGHNHPSGQVLPSEQDKSITKKLRDALKLFDIALLDHIIVGDRKYYSFSDEGIL